jgi:hypothetical protein
MDRLDALEQRGHDAGFLGHGRIGLGALDIGALEHVIGIAGPELVAEGRDVSGDGAVAEGDDGARAAADLVNHVEVILVADRALDQAEVDVLGVLFDVDEGAEDQIELGGQFHKELVEVQEGHVAAGTAA